jgi:hypothetical protein
MKKLSVLAGILCLGTACYMNSARRVLYYPDVPDVLFGKMIQALTDSGYKITTSDPHPDPGLRGVPTLIGEKGQLKITAAFVRVSGETHVTISASQFGDRISNDDLDKAWDEVAAKFDKAVKNK